MNKIFTLIIFVAMTITGITAPAFADSQYSGDRQACVTEQEFDSMPSRSKAEIEQHFDTDGWTAYGDGFYKIKHYAYCGDMKWGWVAVSYVMSKRGWRYRAGMILYFCSQKDGLPEGGFGPAYPCDSATPQEVEYWLLRKAGRHYVRVA